MRTNAGSDTAGAAETSTGDTRGRRGGPVLPSLAMVAVILAAFPYVGAAGLVLGVLVGILWLLHRGIGRPHVVVTPVLCLLAVVLGTLTSAAAVRARAAELRSTTAANVAPASVAARPSAPFPEDGAAVEFRASVVLGGAEVRFVNGPRTERARIVEGEQVRSATVGAEVRVGVQVTADAGSPFHFLRCEILLDGHTVAVHQGREQIACGPETAAELWAEAR